MFILISQGGKILNHDVVFNICACVNRSFKKMMVSVLTLWGKKEKK